MTIARGHDRGSERGASLVEFAVLAPLLVVLLLGIVEFGWATAQQIDLRHKAREALRVAIVDGDEDAVRDRVCEPDVVDPSSISSIDRGGGTAVGSDASVEITADIEQITGFFGWAWGGTTTITSRVEGRNEQEVTQWGVGSTLTCP